MKAKKPAKRGRPRLYKPGESVRFQVRAPVACHAHWIACAAALGITLNSWVNLTLNSGSGRSHKVPTK